jgi:hypothetical protein
MALEGSGLKRTCGRCSWCPCWLAQPCRVDIGLLLLLDVPFRAQTERVPPSRRRLSQSERRLCIWSGGFRRAPAGRSPAKRSLQGPLGEPATSTAIRSCRCSPPATGPTSGRAHAPPDAVSPGSQRNGRINAYAASPPRGMRPGRVKWLHFMLERRSWN